jgi:uncharacterized protein YyaL (SSP411 family)
MNHLSQETSPYLLQHASNPVDWFPWGEEALTTARTEDKPIFLSIGYSACHWCHVMAHESFEDPDTAALMNANFINIKVDREERPDLDSIYMSATIAMTGSGGWPMSVFLNPDLKPFYCGTYFPPDRRYNIPSFREVLAAIASAWQNERENIQEVSAKVTDHLKHTELTSPAAFTLSNELLDTAVQTLLQNFDWGFGGWGQAPKFPQPLAIEFLLRRGGEGVKAALHTLSCMARGGMYDVVGGGFARYATDNLWRVPHFEKMLYDNAQLALAYLHAWQVTGEPALKRVVEETLAFITREMTSPEGGFYSSLDADSEHEEGKFYIWTYNEIQSLLGDELEFFIAAYGLTEQGNWEGRIVLQRALDDATLAARIGFSSKTGNPRELVVDKLTECHSRLLAARNTRIHPGTDDKILTAWNALMLTTFASAARAFWDTQQGDVYLEIARRNAEFLLSQLRPAGKLRRAWRKGKSTDGIFLEDYAALIIALLELYQTDFDNKWYVHATELTDEMIEQFNDPAGGFFDTPSDGEALLLRPKDVQDNATPSGNSMAFEALLRMAALSDRADLRQKAEEMLGLISEQLLRYPTGFARWLSAADFSLGRVKQVAVVGEPAREETQTLIAILREGFHPLRIVAASPLPLPENAPALLHDRPLVDGKPTAYVCEAFVCKQPVTDARALLEQLE